MTHTPAPWRCEAEPTNRGKGLDRFLIVGGESEEDEPLLDITDFMSEADARLIAAAPDLLAALKCFISDHDGFSNEEVERRGRSLMRTTEAARIIAARAAIAKAERVEGLRPIGEAVRPLVERVRK